MCSPVNFFNPSYDEGSGINPQLTTTCQWFHPRPNTVSRLQIPEEAGTILRDTINKLNSFSNPIFPSESTNCNNVSDEETDSSSVIQPLQEMNSSDPPISSSPVYSPARRDLLNDDPPISSSPGYSPARHVVHNDDPPISSSPEYSTRQNIFSDDPPISTSPGYSLASHDVCSDDPPINSSPRYSPARHGIHNDTYSYIVNASNLVHANCGYSDNVSWSSTSSDSDRCQSSSKFKNTSIDTTTISADDSLTGDSKAKVDVSPFPSADIVRVKKQSPELTDDSTLSTDGDVSLADVLTSDKHGSTPMLPTCSTTNVVAFKDVMNSIDNGNSHMNGLTREVPNGHCSSTTKVKTSSNKKSKKRTLTIAAVFNSPSVPDKPCSTVSKEDNSSPITKVTQQPTHTEGACPDVLSSPTSQPTSITPPTTPAAPSLCSLDQSLAQQLKLYKGRLNKIKAVLTTEEENMVDVELDERRNEIDLSIESHVKHIMERNWFEFNSRKVLDGKEISDEVHQVFLKKFELRAVKSELLSLQTLSNVYI